MILLLGYFFKEFKIIFIEELIMELYLLVELRKMNKIVNFILNLKFRKRIEKLIIYFRLFALL